MKEMKKEIDRNAKKHKDRERQRELTLLFIALTPYERH